MIERVRRLRPLAWVVLALAAAAVVAGTIWCRAFRVFFGTALLQS